MTNIELCHKCSNDPGTLGNMERIIIVNMLTEIEEAKMVIKAIPQDKEIVVDFRVIIVENMKAIRVFYSRFPDIPKQKFINRQPKYNFFDHI